jgi:hypothetical protein
LHGGISLFNMKSTGGYSVSLFRRLFRKPTIDEFGAEFVRALQKADATAEFRFESAEGRIVRVRDGKENAVVNLANIFQIHLLTPRLQRAKHLRHCVQLALSTSRTPPTDFDEARANVRPRVWARGGLEAIRLHQLFTESDKGGLDLPCQPIGEHLLACLVYDWPDSVQSINEETLQEWGVTIYEALETALENLGESTSTMARIGEHLYSFMSGDSYDAARIMLIDRISALELDGAPVAMVPDRETLFITGSEDYVGLQFMIELAAGRLGGAYPLSGSPLILQDGEWVDWMPPPTCPAYPKFREMASRFLGSLYSEQKRALEAAFQRGGVDIFVASFSGSERPGGGLVTYCTWGDGIDSLLPVTDKVAFVREHQGMIALGEWEKVVEIAGHLMELTDHYPPRYHVRAFPDQESLDAIGLGEM